MSGYKELSLFTKEEIEEWKNYTSRYMPDYANFIYDLWEYTRKG